MTFQFFRRRIGNKIIGLVGLSAFLSLTGMVVFYTHQQEQSILHQRVENAVILNQSVIQGLDAVMLTGSAEIAQVFASRLKAVPGVVDFRILRINGSEAFQDNKTILEINKLLGREVYAPRKQERLVQVIKENDQYLHRSIAHSETVTYESTSVEGDAMLTFLTPIPNVEECHGCHEKTAPYRGVVKITTSLASIHQEVVNTWLRAALILAIAVVAICLLTFIMLRRVVLRPIHTVTQAMSRATEGDLSHRVPIPSQDEVGKMAENFNVMLERLQITYQGLEREQDKLATIILSAQEGIVVTDRDNKVVLVNPAAERILEKTSSQIIAEGFLQIVDDANYINAFLASWGADMPDTLFYKNRVISINISTIQDSEGRVMGSAALFRDITDEKRLEEKLRELSFTDGLTGLLNRRRMDEVLVDELSRAARYSQKLSLILLDVDHFKQFNDRHGHAQGDRVLIAIARFMKEHFRTNDLCCRYGGEEFCIIMPNTDIPGALYGAERFRQKVEDAIIDEGLKVTVTMGVSIFPRHGIDSASLLKMADTALYQGKQEGRNRVTMIP